MRGGGLLAMIVLASLASGTANAETAAATEEATLDLRAFAGGGSGLTVEGWLPGRHARLDVDAEAFFPQMVQWGGVGGVVPLTGGPRRFSGIRAGYQLEHTATPDSSWRGSRFAHALDAGYVLHLESSGGNVFEGALGLEAVFRAEPASCCDHASLDTMSFGARIALRGELALSPAWALVAQVGLRTGDHLLEIKVLPTVALGIRVRV